jgi:uncharacterized protein YecE (DUF72 family)
MRVWVGTSGFSYPPWRGSFYPEKLPAADMLAFYAQQLPTVEINNTFYRMPTSALLERWSAATPADFVFALKCSRRITHELRLHDAQSAVERFASGAATLGSKLGPVLFQLPPWLHKDLERLQAFLTVLAQAGHGIRPAFEFRHASWFSDDVYATLRSAGAALCIAEAEKLETPLQATTSWGYLRLRREDYTPALLDAWAERIAGQPWSEAYVFVKHETAEAPVLARGLLAALGPSSTAKGGTYVKTAKTSGGGCGTF